MCLPIFTLVIMTAVIVSLVTVVLVTVEIVTSFSKKNTLTHCQPMGYSQGSVLQFLQCFKQRLFVIFVTFRRCVKGWLVSNIVF